MKIQLPAIFSGMSSRADGGWGLRFVTRELRPEEVLELSNRKNTEGWLLYAPNELKVVDVPKYDAELKKKTHSQRLRAVLYKQWEQLSSGEDFESFYFNRMEEIITSQKDMLE